MIRDRIRLKFRNTVYIPLTKKIRGAKIKNKDFTIISNNCWGGAVYNSYNMQKRTPTVGLFFAAEDYLKFLKDIHHYLQCELKFIDPKESNYKERFSNDQRWGHYPIGKLDDIEIFFLHYDSEKKAYDKWNERLKRINWERLLVKFDDQNGCTDEMIEEFDKLPYKNKICFTVSDKFPDLKSVYKIKCPKNSQYVPASYQPIGKCKVIDINALINML